MHIQHRHEWNITPAEAIALQKQMATEVVSVQPIDLAKVRLVAGVDVSAATEDSSERQAAGCQCRNRVHCREAHWSRARSAKITPGPFSDHRRLSRRSHPQARAGANPWLRAGATAGCASRAMVRTRAVSSDGPGRC